MTELEGLAIEGIGNYYGGLHIAEYEGHFYWSIENYDGHDWVEIPEPLYRELVKQVRTSEYGNPVYGDPSDVVGIPFPIDDMGDYEE